MNPSEPLAAILVSKFTVDYRPDAPADNGGRPRLVRDLARHLRGLGYRVRIAQRGREDRLVRCAEGIEVQTTAVPLPAWGDLTFARRTRKLAEQADLCCYASPEDGYPFYSPRSFAIQHGIWWDAPYPGWKRLVIQRWQRERNLRMCAKARAVVCVDSNFINYLRLLGRRGHTAAGKCHYLPNYADCLRLPAPTEEQIGKRFAGRSVLFLRRFEAPRGGREFVEMCRILEARGVRFKARMVGWGAEAQGIASLIRQYGLAGGIELATAEMDSVRQVLEEAAISVVPSVWSEGSSLTAIESLAMGVPVVTTDVGGLPNVIVPEFTGTVTRSHPEDLASSVESLLASEARYRAIARNCLLMRPVFSLERWVERLSQILADARLIGADAATSRQRPAVGAVFSALGGSHFPPASAISDAGRPANLWSI